MERPRTRWKDKIPTAFGMKRASELIP